MLGDEDFLMKDFNVDAFVSEKRKDFTLESLLEALQSYVAGLDGTLVNIINNDYSQFLKLSTMLVNIDAMVSSLRSPLDAVEAKVEGVRKVVTQPLAEQEALLHRYHHIQIKKKLLKSQLSSWEMLGKVESHVESLKAGGSLDHENLSRATQRLARVSFLARSNTHLPLLRVVKAKTRSLENQILEQLSEVFITVFRQNDAKGLSRCLRGYIAISKGYECEMVFQSRIAIPEITEMFSKGRLDAGGARGGASGIVQIYQDLQKFFAKDCGPLLVAVADPAEGLNQMDFAGSFVGAVLDVVKNIAPQLYSSGSADTLHTTYTATKQFLASFPKSAGTVSHGTQLLGLWNLSVYTQLRTSQVVSTLREDLKLPVSVSETKALSSTIVVMDHLNYCWCEDVFLDPVGPGILRMFLAIVTMYIDWCKFGILHVCSTHGLFAPLDTPEDDSTEEISSSAWTKCEPETLLYLGKDSMNIATLLEKTWIPKISDILKLPPTVNSVNYALRDVLGVELRNIQVASKECFQTLLVKLCCGDMDGVKSVGPMYRMTNKPTPTESSEYTAVLLQPLEKVLLHSLILTHEEQMVLGEEVVKGLLCSFQKCALATIEEVRNSEKALLRLKRSTGGNREQDSKKIQVQYNLDLDALENQCQSLGVASMQEFELVKKSLEN